MKKIYLSVLTLFIVVGLYATDLNIYASGLNATQSAGITTIDYVLNAPATSLNLKLYSGETCVATMPITGSANLSKGAHGGVVINLQDVPAGTYNWALEANAAARVSMESLQVDNVTITNSQSRGMTFDDDPESPYFGTLYISSSSVIGTNGAITSVSADRGTVTNIVVDADTWTNSPSSPMRLAIGEDGLLYATDWSDNYPNVVVIDRSTNSATPIFVKNGDDDVTNSSGIVSYSGTAIHGSIPGCCVEGTGTGRTLYTVDEDIKQNGHYAIYQYVIGTMSSRFKSKYIVKYEDTNDYWSTSSGNMNIASDGRGGFWISALRWTDASNKPILSHINATGAKDYSSTGEAKPTDGHTAYRGAMFVNHDHSLIAISAANYTKIFRATYSGNTVTGVSTVASLTTASVDNYNVVLDPANNIYLLNASGLIIYAPATNNNSHETPAKTTNTIEVSTSLDVSLNTLYLDQAIAELSGKTIRRALVRGEHMFVLALDGSNAPYLYRINTHNGKVISLPTDFCSVVDRQENPEGLALSDIAITSDGVLIGCNKEYCTNALSNYFKVYKWTETDGNFSGDVWFSRRETRTAGNFYYSYTGESMAYVGSSTKGTLVATARTTGDDNGAIRPYICFINGGAVSSTKFNRTTAPLRRAELGTDFQLNVLADGETYVLDGSNSKPYKFTLIDSEESGHNVPYALLMSSVQDEAFTNYFVYDAHQLAISTHFISSENDGFRLNELSGSGVTSVTHDAPALSAVSATHAVALGATESDEAYFYVLRDDKLSAYTTANAYTRPGMTVDNFSTICLPYAVDADKVWGAEVYNVAAANGSPLTSITLSQEDDDLVAGKPYVIKPTKNTFACIYTGDEQTTVQGANGLVGKLDESAETVPDDENSYIFNGGQLHKVPSGVTISFLQNRAYFDLSKYVAPTLAPEHKTLTIPAAPNNATGMDNVEQNEEVQKFFRDGKVYIRRGNIVYDALGRIINK